MQHLGTWRTNITCKFLPKDVHNSSDQTKTTVYMFVTFGIAIQCCKKVHIFFLFVWLLCKYSERCSTIKIATVCKQSAIVCVCMQETCFLPVDFFLYLMASQWSFFLFNRETETAAKIRNTGLNTYPWYYAHHSPSRVGIFRTKIWYPMWTKIYYVDIYTSPDV